MPTNNHDVSVLPLIPDITLRQYFKKGEKSEYYSMCSEIILFEQKGEGLFQTWLKKRNHHLSEIYQHGLVSNMLKLKNASQLVSWMREKEIAETGVMKGLYFMATLFSAYPGWRVMGDADLMVTRKDFFRLTQLCQQELPDGFSCLKPRWLAKFRDAELYIRKDKILIEVHRDLTASGVFSLDWDDMLAKGSTEQSYAAALILPDPYDHMMLSLVHAFLSGLTWRYLIELYVELYHLDRKKVIEKAREKRIIHLYNLFLYACYTVFEHPYFSWDEITVQPFFFKVSESNDPERMPLLIENPGWSRYLYGHGYSVWLVRSGLSAVVDFLRKAGNNTKKLIH